MKFSQHETFFWLDDAVLLDECACEDFRKVQRSLEYATQVLIALGGHEVSINELDANKNKSGLTYDSDSGFSFSVKKSELARIAATGNTGNAEWLKKVGVTEAEIKAAKRRKRRPLFEHERVSDVARFLVNYWCGQKGVYEMWEHNFDSKETSKILGITKNANGDYIYKPVLVTDKSRLPNGRTPQEQRRLISSMIKHGKKLQKIAKSPPHGANQQWVDWTLKCAGQSFQDAGKLKQELLTDNGKHFCQESPPFFFVPPLCMMSNGVLAQFVALALKKNNASDQSTSEAAIRKCISRLKLKCPTSLKIREMIVATDGIYFKP
jgi:hypothetical protein